MLHMYCAMWREDLLCLSNCVKYTTLFTVSPSTHFMNSSLAQHLVSFRRHSGCFFEISRVFVFDQGICLKVDLVRIFTAQGQFSWLCSFYYWQFDSLTVFITWFFRKLPVRWVWILSLTLHCTVVEYSTRTAF